MHVVLRNLNLRNKDFQKDLKPKTQGIHNIYLLVTAHC